MYSRNQTSCSADVKSMKNCRRHWRHDIHSTSTFIYLELNLAVTHAV